MMTEYLLILGVCLTFGLLQVDSAAIRASGCPDETWANLNQKKCYKVIPEFVTWSEGSTACESLTPKGRLAMIKTIEQQSFLTNYVFDDLDNLQNVWIGAKRSSSNANNFIWDDGELVSTSNTNWSPGYPTSDHLRECVEMESGLTRGKGGWKDAACESRTYALCEASVQYDESDILQLLLQAMADIEELRANNLVLESNYKELNESQSSVVEELETLRKEQTVLVSNITKLNSNYNVLSSNFSDLKTEITYLEGAVEDLKADLYSIQYSLGDSTFGLIKEIVDVKETIGDEAQGLVMEVLNIKAKVGDGFEGLVKDLEDIKENLDGLNLGTLPAEFNQLKMVVGDDSTGLVKEMADVKHSILSVVVTVGDDVGGLIRDVHDVKTTVGGADSGLVKDVQDIKDAIEGLDLGSLPMEFNDLKNVVGDFNSGLVKDVKDVKDAVDGLNLGTIPTDLQELKTTVGDANAGLVKEVAEIKGKVDELSGGAGNLGIPLGFVYPYHGDMVGSGEDPGVMWSNMPDKQWVRTGPSTKYPILYTLRAKGAASESRQ